MLHPLLGGADVNENTTSATEVSGIKKFFLMKPLMVRAILVATAAIVAKAIGAQVDNELIDTLVNFFTALSAIVLYFIGGNTVTANSKVITKLPDPTNPTVIVKGDAFEVVREFEDNILSDSIKTEDSDE